MRAGCGTPPKPSTQKHTDLRDPVTVMTLDWIAERLQMGCRHTLANCLKGRRTHQ
jgi:hypothetical protein